MGFVGQIKSFWGPHFAHDPFIMHVSVIEDYPVIRDRHVPEELLRKKIANIKTQDDCKLYSKWDGYKWYSLFS